MTLTIQLLTLFAVTLTVQATASAPIWPCDLHQHYPPSEGSFRLLPNVICALNATIIVNNDGTVNSLLPASLHIKGPAETPHASLPVITTAAFMLESKPIVIRSATDWLHRLFRVGSTGRRRRDLEEKINDLPAWATCADNETCTAPVVVDGDSINVAVNGTIRSQPSGILLLENLILRGGISRHGGGAVFVALRGLFRGSNVVFEQNRAPLRVPTGSWSSGERLCCVDGPCEISPVSLSSETRASWLSGMNFQECDNVKFKKLCEKTSLCAWLGDSNM